MYVTRFAFFSHQYHLTIIEQLGDVKICLYVFEIYVPFHKSGHIKYYGDSHCK